MKYIPGDIVLVPDYWGSGDNRPHLVIHTDIDQGLRLCPFSRADRYRLPSDYLPARPGGLNCGTNIAAMDGIDNTRWQLFWVPPTAVRRLVGTLDQELLQVALLAVVRQQQVCKTARARKAAVRVIA